MRVKIFNQYASDFLTAHRVTIGRDIRLIYPAILISLFILNQIAIFASTQTPEIGVEFQSSDQTLSDF